MLANCGMNLRKYVASPKKDRTCSADCGGGHFCSTATFLVSILTPSWPMIWPKKGVSAFPKAHLDHLQQNLASLSSSNT
jgi:hypothetical protein